MLVPPKSEAPFDDIDVSGWFCFHEEPLGTKPKRWLHDPSTDSDWLMKDVTFNSRADGSRYAKGDDWAERIANAVAEALGLPAAEVELAHGGTGRDSDRGVISRLMVAEGESLIHGNELLEEIGVSGKDTHDRTGYTLDAVRRSLAGVDPPSGCDGSAWEIFVGYLVLDAVIGNTDRHQENWAVISTESSRRLAPTFDHASCLGFQLDDLQRLERLGTSDANRSPEGYAARARSRFDGAPSPSALAVEGLRTLASPVRERWLERIANPVPLADAIDRVPAHRMSDPARAFAGRVLRANAARLSEAVGTV